MSVQVEHERAAECEFDAEMRFRSLGMSGTWIAVALLLSLSTFHFYAASFGLLREQTHRGIHTALVLGLIFLFFAAVPATATGIVSLVASLALLPLVVGYQLLIVRRLRDAPEG